MYLFIGVIQAEVILITFLLAAIVSFLFTSDDKRKPVSMFSNRLQNSDHS